MYGSNCVLYAKRTDRNITPAFMSFSQIIKQFPDLQSVTGPVT